MSQDRVSSVNHYSVLGLPVPTQPGLTQYSPEKLKILYRQALLQNHPDKDGQKQAAGLEYDPRSTSHAKFTVDQILQAYECLSNPSTQAQYERHFLDGRNNLVRAAKEDGRLSAVEQYDLEELHYDDGTSTWSLPCRCGGSYRARDEDLGLSAADGELVIACSSCSLAIKVTYAEAD